MMIPKATCHCVIPWGCRQYMLNFYHKTTNYTMILMLVSKASTVAIGHTFLQLSFLCFSFVCKQDSLRPPLYTRICYSRKRVCMSSPWHSSTSIYSSVSQHWSQTERLQPAGRQPYRPVLTASDHAPEPYPRLHAWYPPPEERHTKQCGVHQLSRQNDCVWGSDRMELTC